MRYLKGTYKFFMVIQLIIASKYIHAQKCYYFENVKNGKSYGMGQNQLLFDLEIKSNDTNIDRIYKRIYCSVDSFSENQLFISKSNETIEIYFKNGEVQTAVNSFTKKGYIVSYSFKDSIYINDITKVNDRSEFFDRYKFVTSLAQVVGVSLGAIVIGGPFIFNDYFKVVGISFVSSIPIFITSGILQNTYILRGRKQGKEAKWRLVYK
ncbi:MAG: hypothetical protein V4643_10630 [Bacteroidota bacterium]